MKIRNISFDDKNYHFFEDDMDHTGNLFTILIGRNGSGKSRILQKICYLHLYSLLSNHEFPHINQIIEPIEINKINNKDKLKFGRMDYQSNGHNYEIIINEIKGLTTYHTQPFTFEKNIKDSNITEFNSIKKIIAVSTSPFDKFPTPLGFSHFHNAEIFKKYIYRGAKVKINSNKDYLKTKFDQLGSSLINFFLKSDKNKNKVSILLKTINVNQNISMFFSFPWPFNPFEIIQGNNGKTISESLKSILFFKNKPENINITSCEENLILKSLEFVIKFYNYEYFNNDLFRVDLDLFNISDMKEFDLLNSLSVLANYDLIELVDIKFIKNSNSFNLTEASSGELSLIFNLLSIAGEIEDDSLILIDEPEISLHPEWQSDFLPLLKKMFSEYKGCHFIIATHSPHILSSIEDNSSFIINLENDNEIIKGEKIAKMSADYQLAYAFKEPGYRNEYLTRIALTVFTNVSKNKKFLSGDYESLKLLQDNFDHLKPNDPVHQLILSLEELSTIYA